MKKKMRIVTGIAVVALVALIFCIPKKHDITIINEYTKEPISSFNIDVFTDSGSLAFDTSGTCVKLSRGNKVTINSRLRNSLNISADGSNINTLGGTCVIYDEDALPVDISDYSGEDIDSVAKSIKDKIPGKEFVIIENIDGLPIYAFYTDHFISERANRFKDANVDYLMVNGNHIYLQNARYKIFDKILIP